MCTQLESAEASYQRKAGEVQELQEALQQERVRGQTCSAASNLRVRPPAVVANSGLHCRSTK
jgi:hypothetical protein